MGEDFSRLKKYFDHYRLINHNYRLRKSLILHPNIDFNYFKRIDTKQKAYWLGWLYAEGHLSRRFLKIEIGAKDGILIKKFANDLGLNPRKVHFYRRYNEKSHTFSLVLFIKIYNNEFRNFLIKLGFPIGKKSGIIRFPDFTDPHHGSASLTKELEMAFILGFFDGDGSHTPSKGNPNTPVIYSKSKAFLQDIVQKSDLPPYIIPKPKYEKKGKTYYLGIGAKFFMSLLDNFSSSLPRKRAFYLRFYNKFLFTKVKLQQIVEKNPPITTKEIANLHFNLTGVKTSIRTVTDKLNKWDIKRESKDQYFWKKTVELRTKGWSLRRIYEKEFKLKNWGTYSKVFFKRVFKNDLSLLGKKNDIHKNIEKTYKKIL
ncbi:hypothetical protein LCGC14_1723280 [marine sediment metagenome]|uniref:Homing endonuclease LAGLIDADG domain-containing protein n=1 Tax=marine sediment metagenome TaxID=412755 RepID=A0A0F9HBW0_9ZZZZ